MSFLVWLEQLRFSQWLNESSSVWAYPMFLFMHTLGLSIVAGGAAMIDFAIIGLWPKTPIKPLERLFPIIWVGFGINLVTGISMLMKDATTKGTNVDFWIKMLFVLAGTALLPVMRTRIFGDPALDRVPVSSAARRLAWASLLCWFGAIIAGRLIAYVGPVSGIS
jgi:hypothetical protein